MRAKFEFLKPYKLYKNLTIVFTTKRKQYENSVLLYSPSLESSEKIINSTLFDIQHIRSFYMDKWYDKTIFKRTIPTDRLDVYESIKDSTGVSLTPLNAGVLRLRNTFFPAYQELNMLFQIPGAKNKAQFIKNFALVNDLLMKRGNDEIYKDRYVVLDGTIFGEEFGNNESENIKGLCLGSLFYLAAKAAITAANPSKWPLAGKKCILVEPNTGMMFIIPPDIAKLTLARFRWMLNLCHKGATKKTITEEDLKEEGINDEPVKVKSTHEYFLIERASNGAKATFPAKTKVYESVAEAVIGYLNENYPDAGATNVEEHIVITGDDKSSPAIKELMSKHLALYSMKDTEKSSFNVTSTSIKAKSSVTMEQKQLIGIKKSGDKIHGVMVVIDKSEENPVLASKKEEIINSVAGIKNGVPLTSSQKELIYTIKDRVDEISIEAKGKTLDEMLKMIDDDAKITDLKVELKANRLQEVQNIQKTEVLEKLEEKQQNAILEVNGKKMSFNDRLEQLEKTSLEPEELNINVVNPEIKKAIVPQLRKAYRKDLYDYDQYRIFTSFADSKEFPIFVESLSREDTSDAYNAKETINVKFNIAGGAPKSMTIDVPKIDQDGFLYLQGNRRQITNQITMMPIVKVWQSGDLAVQYSTSYNKIFVSRSTQILNRKVASLKKGVERLQDEKKLSGVNYNILLGKGYRKKYPEKLPIEYEELSKFIYNLQVDELKIEFDPEKAKLLYEKIKPDEEKVRELFPKDEYWFIGTYEKDPLFAAIKGGVSVLAGGHKEDVETSISALIYKAAKDVKYIDELLGDSKYTGSNLMYTKLEVANAYIPLIVFLGYKDGVEEVLDKYNVEYKFVPIEKPTSKPNLDPEYPERVRFRNGYLMFKDSNPGHLLLVNGLYQLDTAMHNFDDYKANGVGFNDWFAAKLTPRYGKALQNFYVLFIDPITKDILRDKGIPQDITGSFLYCNDLLTDSTFKHRYDVDIYRLRNTECINAMLYRVVAREIESYRRTGIGTGGVFKVKRNALMDEINNTANFEDSTLINPIKDSENMAKAIFKGPGAPDYQHAQGTEEHRFFDKGMVGIYGYSSSYDGNAGMNKKISMNSSITSERGYLKKVDPNKVDAATLYTSGELAASFTATHADPARSMMAVLQTGHMIPSIDMDASLVSTGVFKAMPSLVSQDYCFKAPTSGVVEGFDSKDKHLLKLKYNDGTKGIIDMSPRYCRTPSGFFVHIEYQLSDGVKAGKKFNEGDILAYDKHFFSEDYGEGLELMKGIIAKVAVCGRDQTYEDASIISERLSEKLASELIEEVSLGMTADTNLISIKKIGDHVDVGDDLAVFEDRLESSEISKLLSKIDDETKDALTANARNSKQTKYEGKIVDIEIFYDRPIEEYSPSLQKLIKAYITDVQNKAKLCEGVRNDQIIRRKDIEPAKYGKAKGVPFEGVMINFYISHILDYSVGDKITYDVALKSIVSRILPQDKTPYTNYRPDKTIDACMSGFGVLNRKVPDVFYLGYTNKALIGLKERIEEIWGGK